MSNLETKWVGQALERVEDRRLLTRGGHFIDDLTLPGVAYAAYVRSPHARAKIRRIDLRRALEHPGVYAAITGDEVAQLTRPQRGRVPLANSPKVYALAYQQVRRATWLAALPDFWRYPGGMSSSWTGRLCRSSL